ncbi:MAG: hypothetical protein VYE68_09315 [Acidobacteriota bacterium]|nr:hypothetical protein [Acidobacteriota bacterium]
MRTSTNLSVIVSVMLAWAILPVAANDDGRVPEHPTFTRNVLPILQRSCQTCHRPDMFTPMSLLTYEEVRPWARSIKQRVEARIMPPWFANRTVGTYRDDPSLSETEIATIGRWVDQGAPRGNPADKPTPVRWPAVNDWYHGEEPDLIVTSPPIEVAPNSTETFPEPEMTTGLTEDRYIKWIQVLPGKPRVVHHVLVFAVRPEMGEFQSEDAAQDAGPNRVRELLANRARGDFVGDYFEDGYARLLRSDDLIRLQLHYLPDNERSFTDQTRVGIKLYPAGYVPDYVVTTRTVSNRDLLIPPGAPNARSDAYFTLPEPARIISFQPHMHYRGKRMTLEAIHPSSPRPELLSDIDRFAWDWQPTYVYETPLTLPAGTVMHVTAFHDNSAANRVNPDPTAAVGWGDRTIDEMNIGWLDFFYIPQDEYTAQLEP